MKKIIGILLLTILAYAEHNSTNQLEQDQSKEIKLLKSDKKLLVETNSKLRDNIKKLTIEKQKLQEENKGSEIKIQSIPEVKLAIDQPINFALIIFPIISMLITMLIIYLSYRATRRQLELNHEQSNNILSKTLAHEKELKQQEIIAKSRQKWMDELRKEVGQYIGTLNELMHLHIKLKDGDPLTDSDKERQKELYSETAKMQANLSLLLNTKEESHRKLIELIGAVTLHMISMDEKPDVEYYGTSTYNIHSIARDIIKEEWGKIKNSE